MAFHPKRLAGAEGMSIVGLTLEIPYAWSDGNVYLHLENVGSAYSLWINDRAVAEVEDPATPRSLPSGPMSGRARTTSG